jgi:hypothetical protein
VRFESEREGQVLTAAGILGRPEDFNARGRVLAATSGAISLGEEDYVYLKLDDTDGVECGTLLSLYRKNPDRVRTADGVRHVYRVVSTVQVIRVDDKVATAKIRDSYSQEQVLAATHETVFLDVGTNDGVEVGTALFLVSQNDGAAGRLAKPDSRLPQRVTGRLVVVRADEKQSTAVIVDAAEELQFGTRVVGTPNQSN